MAVAKKTNKQTIKQKQYCNKFNKDFKNLVPIKKKCGSLGANSAESRAKHMNRQFTEEEVQLNKTHLGVTM